MSGRKEIGHAYDVTLMCKEVNYLNHLTNLTGEVIILKGTGWSHELLGLCK